MSKEKVFAVIDEAGDAFAYSRNLREAIDEGKAQTHEVFGDTVQLSTEAQRNPLLDTVDGGWSAYFLTGLYSRLADQGVVLGRVPAPRQLVPYKRELYTSRARYPYSGGEPWYGFTVEKIYSMSLEEARRRIRPYLPSKKAWDKTPEAKFLATNTKTAKILGAEHGEVDHFSKSIGLSLMPHQMPYRVSALNGASPSGYQFRDDSPEYSQELQRASNSQILDPHDPREPPRTYTLCAGSVGECRKACLVYAGQNPATAESFQVKLALSYALLNEPHAFLRVLAESCQREFARGPHATKKDLGEVAAYLTDDAFDTALALRPDIQHILEKTAGSRTSEEKAALTVFKREVKASVVAELQETAKDMARTQTAAGGKASIHRWIRLNVLSDIPWELIVPDFFSGKPVRMPSGKKGGFEMRPFCPPWGSFYDYTKNPGRAPGPNYDLTLSYAGDNQEACAWQLARGGKVAAVFVRVGELEEKTRKKGEAAAKKYGYKVEAETYYTKFEAASTGHKIGQREFAKRGERFIPMSDKALVELFGGVYPVINGDLTDVRGEDRTQFDLGDRGAIVHLAYKPSQAAYYKTVTHGGQTFRIRELATSFDLDAEVARRGAAASDPSRFEGSTRKVSFVVACKKVGDADNPTLVLDGGVTGFATLDPEFALKIATFMPPEPPAEVETVAEVAEQYGVEVSP